MPLTVEQFVAAAQSAGVITPQELDSLLRKLPNQQLPGTVDDMARALESHGRLTRLQQELLLNGKGQELQFGEYVVLDRIGAGGMGVVYRAMHRRMKRLAAIKTLHPDATHDKELTARFQREVEVAARLTHPNIVAAHDAGDARGVLYLATEYVDGVDLGHIIERERRLPLPTVVSYVLQAAHGLAYAHGAGVIHRDIKPANLMLDRQGTIKILDMGLARMMTQESSPLEATARGLTKSSVVMGTADYLAPEQARNSKYADERSDIYSLGATLYRLAAGTPLYSGETLVEKLLAHRDDPIPSLCAAVPECPPELDAVFQKMVAKTPDERFQRMSEVIVRLEGALPSARDATLIRPAETFFTENSAALRASMVTPGIDRESTMLDAPGKARAGSGLTGSGPLRSHLSDSDARPLAPQRDWIVAGSALVVAAAALVALGFFLFRPPPPYMPSQQPPVGQIFEFTLPAFEHAVHIDLLALFKPTHSPTTNWHRDAQGVSSSPRRARESGDGLAVLNFGMYPPREYDLTLEIESIQGPGPILIALPPWERQDMTDRLAENDPRVIVWLDWRPPPPPGGHPPNGKREPDFIFHERATIVCRVRKNGVECNGRPVTARRDTILGPLAGSFDKTPNNSLFVAAGGADYRITRAVLSRAEGEPEADADNRPKE